MDIVKEEFIFMINNDNLNSDTQQSSKKENIQSKENDIEHNNNLSEDPKGLQTNEVPESKNVFKANHKYFTIMIYALAFVAGTILIYKFIGHFGDTMSYIGDFISMISPFLVGIFIAFVLYPLVKMLYKRVFTGWFKVKSEKCAKMLSILVAYIIAIGIIAILMVFIIPQIYESLKEISEQMPVWYDNIVAFLKNFEESHTDWDFINYDTINQRIESALPSIIDYLSKLMTNAIPVIFTTSMAIVKGVINFIIAIMVSVYMISDHKNLFYEFKRLLYAVLPKKAADTTKRVVYESGRIFTSFIFGKALDSLIIGIICFICMMIFKFPYAVLISVIVGITNMIPYFGPYIGGVIGGIIIVLVNPIKVIFFAILILVIQQFDGLYLGPKILGDKTGLKPLWVIFSITVGGSLFGIIGMFLGVPCVAVIRYILDLIITHFLKKKNVEVKPYKHPDRMI